MTHLKFGRVCDTDNPAGLVRVEFAADGITSHWLPVASANTGSTKASRPLDVNEQVVCVMDEHCEDGVVIGAIYSEVDTPGAGAGNDKYLLAFSDGATVIYDRAAHKLAVKISTTEFEVATNGFIVKRGGESLRKILVDLIDQILLETHPTSTGPSGPPINASAYSAIKTRLNDLLP